METKKDKKNMKSWLIILVLILSVNSYCMAGIVEFTDEAAFVDQTGDPQYFIDFESYGDGSPVIGSPDIIGDEWSNLGVYFAPISGTSLFLYDSPTKPEYVSPTHTLYPHGTDRSSYLITFSEPVTSFGVYIVDSETTSINEKITIIDINGNSEDFVMPVGGSLSAFFRGYSSDIPIVEVRIIEDQDGEGLLLDNVMYSVYEGPQQQEVTDIIDTVEDMDLPQGLETSFTQLLNAAKNSLGNGNTQAAIKQLEAFINIVEAQRGKQLTDEQADLLITLTLDVIELLDSLI